MAEYPGLPNWGYGLNIPAETLLQLIPGTQQNKAAKAETLYRENMAKSVPEAATTGRMEAENRGFADMAHALSYFENFRGMDGKLPPDLQMAYDEVIRRMGMQPGPRGLPAAPGTYGVTPDSLNKARGEASQPIFSGLINKIGGDWFGKMLFDAIVPKPQGELKITRQRGSEKIPVRVPQAQPARGQPASSQPTPQQLPGLQMTDPSQYLQSLGIQTIGPQVQTGLSSLIDPSLPRKQSLLDLLSQSF